jgi:hypothetical protein
MLDDIKKDIESSMAINSKGNTKPSSSATPVTVIPQVIIGNPADVIIDIAIFQKQYLYLQFLSLFHP